MAVEFTKGPWNIHFGGLEGDDFAVIDSPFKENGRGICNLEPGQYEQANAFLIAAAPDMFDACYWADWLLDTREIKSLLEKYRPQWGDPDEIRRKLKASLKKARGEE